MENKDLKTPKEEKNLVLVIENANTELKVILNNALMYGYNKQFTKSLVSELIKKTKAELEEMEAPKDIIHSTEVALKQTFLRQYTFMLTILEKSKKSDKSGIIALTLKKLKSNVPYDISKGGGIVMDVQDGINIYNAQINNLRDYLTEVQEAAGARYVDYANLVQEKIIEIGDGIADGTLTELDKLGRHKSIRNMAEINVRYNLIVDDVKRQGLKVGKDFCIASSHPNQSERCSYWASKIFLIDIDVATREMGQFDKNHPPTPKIIGHTPDGKPYYSLKQACENGFLSYNCQHRLVKYYKGANPPIYDIDDVADKRNLTTTQRVLENRVRQYKARTKISNTGVKINRKAPYLQQVRGNWYWFKDGENTYVKASEHTLKLKSMPTSQKHRFSQHHYNNIMANYWEDTYIDFSETHNAPIYKWRLRITETERMVRDL